MEPLKKRISSSAINALTEALVHIYWYKAELKSFVHNTVDAPEVLSRINWDKYKREIVSNLMLQLTSNQDKYLTVLIRLMEEVSKITNFSHLEKLEDGIVKAQNAKIAVEAIRNQIGSHFEMIQELQNQEQRRQDALKKLLSKQDFKTKLRELKDEYFSLLKDQDANTQKRGFRLEKIIRVLFEIHDLDPKASFRITGEQIDGAFVLENIDFLFEAKWQKNAISADDLDVFSRKVERKLDNTLGLFLSINGFSIEGVQAHSQGKKMIILMDGLDLIEVLEDRIDLLSLLTRKKRHASQTGNIYLKVNDLY